jgi:hypothetical protein
LVNNGKAKAVASAERLRERSLGVKRFREVEADKEVLPRSLPLRF